MWPKREECYSLYARNLKSESKVPANNRIPQEDGGGLLLSLIASGGPWVPFCGAHCAPVSNPSHLWLSLRHTLIQHHRISTT